MEKKIAYLFIIMFHFDSLKNKLLIAAPTLKDDCFHQSLVYLYEHNEEGSIGFIINKPSKVQLEEVLNQVGIVSHTFSYPKHYTVLTGGPLYPNEIFLMHPKKIQLEKKLALLTPKQALLQFANDTLPENILFVSGYAAWGAKQLENEFKKNAWMVSDFNETILNLPYDQRWQAVAKLNGIDMNNFCDIAGHA